MFWRTQIGVRKTVAVVLEAVDSASKCCHLARNRDAIAFRRKLHPLLVSTFDYDFDIFFLLLTIKLRDYNLTLQIMNIHRFELKMRCCLKDRKPVVFLFARPTTILKSSSLRTSSAHKM
jgi:hypothetical protein